MKNQISKAKLAALAVGLAVVMSSCGIQNQAGDSSSASGKTKNYALVNGYCYDSIEQWAEANNSVLAEWNEKYNGEWSTEAAALLSTTQPHIRPDGSYDDNFDFNAAFAGLSDGVPCPAGTTFVESSGVPVVPLQANGLPKDCYTQEFIDATVAGFEQQRDKPDATDAYKAEMQKGIDTMKATCVKN